MRAIVAIMATGLIAPAAPGGAGLTGTWVGQLPARNGVAQEIAFQFVQNGTKLGGKLYGDYQSSAITEGVVSGPLVTFVVTTPEQAGNQINDTRLRFTGRMVDGELELTRERERAFNAGNSGDVQFRAGSKQTFRLRKLF